VITNGVQQGSWNDINEGECNDDIPNTPVDECLISADVFTARLNHSGNTTPVHNTSYYYIVAPGQAPSAYFSSEPTIDIEVLENSASIQAVKKEEVNVPGADLAGIIYYPDGFTETPIDVYDCVFMFTDQPCIVLYDQSKTEEQICISSPDRLEPNITFSIITTEGLQQFSVILPINANDTEEPTACLTLPSNIITAISSNCENLAGFQLQQDNCEVGFTANGSGLIHKWYRGAIVAANIFSTEQEPSLPGNLF
jgi:Polysaccharide lyase family 8, C-terminal beta-sandwich domain